MSWHRFHGDGARVDHERALELASWSLVEPLSDDEERWLRGHLDGCTPCATAAADFERQSTELRQWAAPEPPRDLWARTAVALDQAESRTGSSARGEDRNRRGAGARRPGRPRYAPVTLGSLAAVLVVAVVIGASWLSGGLILPPGGTGPEISTALPGATPIVVPAGPVAWVTRNADGTYAINQASVQQVCPPAAGQGCAPLDGTARQLAVLDAAPEAVILSSADTQAVILGQGTTTNGGSVYVVPLATPSSAPASPSTTPRPVVTPAPTPTPTSSASASSPTPSPSSSPTPSPTPSPSPSTAPSPSPTASGGTGGQLLAIASDVVVVGGSGAYSADGAYFAFSARPADGSAGPDIYVWRVGDPQAQRVTNDHSSIFSSWLGDLVLGSDVVLTTPEATASPLGSPAPSASATAEASSSPTPSAQPSASGGADITSGETGSTFGSLTAADATATPRSFVLDPTTGLEQGIGLGIWRPVVDPTGRYVAYWNGTLRWDAASSSWIPAQGDLFLGAWTSPSLQEATGSPEPSTSPAASPSASPSTEATPTAATSIAPMTSEPPSSSGGPTLPTQSLDIDPGVAAGATTTWDLRWDASGAHLAVWVAGEPDVTIGRLSLVTLDESTGLIDSSNTLLTGAPALQGFSIGADRLAWATPPGQDNEGSRVLVLAWKGADAGKVSSQPVASSSPLVVAR